MISKIKKEKKLFLNTRTIAFCAMYLAIMIIFSFTPQLGYVNIGITSFTTMIIPITFMSIHYGWKGAMVAWFSFGVLYFMQVFYTFAGILGIIGWSGAFVVYFLGKIIAGIIMTVILKAFEEMEKRKAKRIANNFWWLTLKIVVVAALGSILNGLFFMILWYGMDPSKSLVTLSIFMTNFGIAFAIEIPLTIFISVSAIPLFKYMVQIEKNCKENSY